MKVRRNGKTRIPFWTLNHQSVWEREKWEAVDGASAKAEKLLNQMHKNKKNDHAAR